MRNIPSYEINNLSVPAQIDCATARGNTHGILIGYKIHAGHEIQKRNLTEMEFKELLKQESGNLSNFVFYNTNVVLKSGYSAACQHQVRWNGFKLY